MYREENGCGGLYSMVTWPYMQLMLLLIVVAKWSVCGTPYTSVQTMLLLFLDMF